MAQLAASVTAAAASLMLAGNPPVALAAGAITGTVFQDANANGAQDGAEAGLAGITVTAWQSGTLPISTTTTTDASGLYTLTLAGSNARIEFTGLPFGLESSPVDPAVAPAGSNTSVRFVTTPASSVNFGLFQPGAYCQNNPQLITACFTAGDNIGGADQGKTNVFSFPYNATGNSPAFQTSLAIAKQVGSVFGVAYQRHTRSAFVSAYTKRLASYGPGTGTPNSDGTGTIYRILNDGSNTVLPFVDLDDLFGAATTGANPHTSFVPAAGDFDGGAFGAAGKTSLGDVDIGEDDSTLWTVNLADRTLYGLPLGTGPVPVAPAASQVISAAIPSIACTNGTGRPFAVKPFNGQIYVGGVCTGEDNGTAADLQAYVYAYNPGTATWTGPVLQFPLNYPRTCVDIFASYPTICKGVTAGSLARWRPWSDVLDPTFPAGYAEGYVANPQPILSGIDFVPNGTGTGVGISGFDMVVAFRDRWGDQIGSVDPGPANNSPRGGLLNAVPAGDILRASLNAGAPAVGAWTIESNAQSSPAGTFGPSVGANTNQGPGGGEFYSGDFLARRHDEIVYGGIVYVSGLSTTVATAMDPIIAETSGVIFLNNTTGLQSNSYEVRSPVPYGQTSNFDFRKANGMGDIEAMCDSAPIEIGNRVWLDADHNGVQDPGEAPIANVAVRLTTSSGSVVTATTNAEGEYRFSSAIGTSTANAVYNLFTGTVVLAPFSAYTLTVDTLQPAVAAYSLTLPTADPSANGTARDSNGVLVDSVAVAVVTTGGAGANNYTYDFGFYQVPPPPPPIVLNLGNRVWYDTNNNGTIEPTEVGVDGVALNLYNDVNGDGVFTPGADGPVLGTQITRNGGYYTFTGLSEGGYLVVITSTQFAPGTPLYGYCNSTSSDSGNTNIDNRNHGNVFGPIPSATTPGLCLSAANIVASTVVTLTPNSEPPDDGDGTNGNLTIDFGFYRMFLGNLVWNDFNHNGTWEPNEPGVPGVTVRLLTPSASVVQTTTTDASGIYTFTGLISGTYCGEIVLPLGYTNTITVPTSIDPNNDVDNDNNGVIVIGTDLVRSNCMAMTPGAEPFITNTTGTSANPTLDFGLWQPSVIQLSKTSVPPPSTASQPSQVGIGTRITYTLNVHNVGISVALNVVLSDVVPADTVFAVGSATPVAAPVNNVISWTIPQLAVGETAEVSFAVDVVSRNGVAIENTAYALSSRTPLTLSNRVVHVFTPTAITLVNFDATGTADRVLVQWGTGLELDTFGFLLYRSATGSKADRELVTSQMIPAQGGNGSYRFEDKQVVAGTHYTYWLVEVEQSAGGDPKLIEQGSTSVAFGAPVLQGNGNTQMPASAASIGGGVLVQGGIAGVPTNEDSRALSQMAAQGPMKPAAQTHSVTKIESAPAAVQPVAAPVQASEPNRASNVAVDASAQIVPSEQAQNTGAPSDTSSTSANAQPAAEVAVSKAEADLETAPAVAAPNEPVAVAQPAQSVQANVQPANLADAQVNASAEQAVAQKLTQRSNVLWLAVLAGLTLVAVAGAGLVVGVVKQARRRG